jgi:decaprenylphospho-beta-D-ribofuranose 2-oxidase
VGAQAALVAVLGEGVNVMPRARVMQLSGWGNVLRQRADVYRPEKLTDLRAVVSGDAQGASPSIVPRGLGRSYGDAALNENGAVLLDTRLNRFSSFDRATGILECEAGVSYEDLIDVFLPRGFFPPVTPGTRFVTLGGAIAADVHGKNHHRDGSIANFIESFDLLIADGRTLRCSRQDNADAFWATLGGMGLTGIILSARLRLQPVESAYVVVDQKRSANLEQTLAAFSDGDHDFKYSVAWIDCLAKGASLGRSVLMRGNHAKAGDLPADLAVNPLVPPAKRRGRVPFNFPSFALSPFTVRLFNARYYASHKDGRHIAHYEDFFYPLDAIEHWNRIYGRRGFFQYQAVFPMQDGDRCLRSLMERISAAGSASFLAVLKTMGPGSGGILSFPIPGLTLALDLPNAGTGTVRLLHELDEIVLKHGGRVYLAKDACMTRESFQRMYPSLPRFNEIKSALDPQNRFSSSLARRLGIGAPA